jgi:hypothetical protein
MAPIKLALDDAALDKDSKQDASERQHPPSLTKPVSDRGAEIVAPAPAAKAKL